MVQITKQILAQMHNLIKPTNIYHETK